MSTSAPPLRPIRALALGPIPASLRAPTQLRIIPGGAGTQTPPQKHLPPRGVREADYRLGGYRVLEAIDSRGECVKRVRIVPGVNEEIAWQWLLGYLEHVDEFPHHRFITGL